MYNPRDISLRDLQVHKKEFEEIVKFTLRVRAGVHLHHAIYSSTENATDKKLIKIIT